MVIIAASREAITEYIVALGVRGGSPETIKKARILLAGLALMLGDTALLDATPAHLVAWQRERSKVLSSRSLRSQTGYVRAFYQWAWLNELITVDPSARVKGPKCPQLLPRPASEATVADVLDAADDWMRALLGLAAFAGLRACEIGRLEWANIQLDGPEPWLRVIGKGSKERIIDLSPLMVRILRALPTRRGPVLRRRDGQHGHCTPNLISKAASRFLKELEVTDTLHAFRHRFGTEVTRHGGLRVAQVAMGHSSPNTTAGYAQVLRSDTRPAIVAAGEIRTWIRDVGHAPRAS